MSTTHEHHQITIFNGKTHYKWPFSIAKLTQMNRSSLPLGTFLHSLVLSPTAPFDIRIQMKPSDGKRNAGREELPRLATKHR